VSTQSFLEGAGWALENWLELLEKHGVQHVALSAHGDGALMMRLLLSGAWEVEWENGESVLLSRIRPLRVSCRRSNQLPRPR
jgi:hypothetical protein